MHHPNTRMLRADSINSLKPMMKELYDLGKKDRSDGLTPEQARQRVESFSYPDVLSVGKKQDSSARSMMRIIPKNSVRSLWKPGYLHTGTATTDALNLRGNVVAKFTVPLHGVASTC